MNVLVDFLREALRKALENTSQLGYLLYAGFHLSPDMAAHVSPVIGDLLSLMLVLLPEVKLTPAEVASPAGQIEAAAKAILDVVATRLPPAPAIAPAPAASAAPVPVASAPPTPFQGLAQ